MEFADTLAVELPSAEAKKIRKELGELGVRVIRIGTLPERMSYDKEAHRGAGGQAGGDHLRE